MLTSFPDHRKPSLHRESLNDVRLACLRHERSQISRPLDVPHSFDQLPTLWLPPLLSWTRHFSSFGMAVSFSVWLCVHRCFFFGMHFDASSTPFFASFDMLPQPCAQTKRSTSSSHALWLCTYRASRIRIAQQACLLCPSTTQSFVTAGPHLCLCTSSPTLFARPNWYRRHAYNFGFLWLPCSSNR